MPDITESEDRRAVLKGKLRQWFDGRIVRKDLTKKSKKAPTFPLILSAAST